MTIAIQNLKNCIRTKNEYNFFRMTHWIIFFCVNESYFYISKFYLVLLCCFPNVRTLADNMTDLGTKHVIYFCLWDFVVSDPQHDEKVFAEIVRKCKELLSSNDAKKQSASSINEKTQSILSDFVTCQKCSGTFRDPRLMPCSHTFCKECLANWEKSQSGALTCPKCWVKCDIPVDKLPVDTRATQLIEGGFQAGSASSSQATATIKTELAKWFEDNSIPTEAQKVLIDEAFDSLEDVLELTKDSLDKLTELKEGHRLKILKLIEKSKPNFDAISKSEEMKLVESIFDERILESGTHPKDASKFWAAFDEKQRDDVTSQFKKIGRKTYKL